MEKLNSSSNENNQEKSQIFLDKIKDSHPEIFALISNNYNSESPLKINEENKIETDEGTYLNIPRVQELVRISSAIKEKLPVIPEGCIRLWRGNRQKEVGKNPSYTNSLSGIALPFLIGYNGTLSYIDVPKELSEKFLKKGCVAEDSEFIVSPEILSNVQIVGLNENETQALLKQSITLQEEDDGKGGWASITV